MAVPELREADQVLAMTHARAAQIRETEFARRERQGTPLWRSRTLAAVRSALIVCAAPRSGSSLLFSILRRSGAFYSPSGETNPFFKLNGFSRDSFPSDAVPARAARDTRARKALSRDLLADCSVAMTSRSMDGAAARRRYIDALMLRLPLQWPDEPFSREAVERAARQAFGVCDRRGGFEPPVFYPEFLAHLKESYPRLDPYYYDLPAELIARRFPGLPVPSAPPCASGLLEEPPFILQGPGRPVTAGDLAGKTLLLKSSADSYRLGFLRSLLPSARIRVIHLVRNPAASVNGLYDGWLHRGFFSHDVGPCLRIQGYSEQGAWARRWWKYDLPPGWRGFRESRLEEVCAFQWYSANRAILRGAGSGACLVRYERIACGPGSRSGEIARIADFCGIPALKRLRLDRLPVVQATRKPHPFRWEKRKDIIMPVATQPRMRRMAAALGYDPADMREWI